MRDINEKFYMDLISNLKIDCEKCFGFCCSALYFAKAEGFPEDKVAGKPCMNLKEDFKCKIHKSLSKKGLKGCTTYECFGAGQKIAQDTYKGESWLDNKEKASEMFDAFVKMMQLHEMLWYLAEAYRIERKDKEREAIKKIIDETINISNLAGDKLIKYDIVAHRFKVNKLLLKTSESVRKYYKGKYKGNFKCKKFMAGRPNLINADLRRNELRGENLSSALLIAANLSKMNLSGIDFLGADLIDTDITGSNLRNAVYLTQFQINSAKGDGKTVLPPTLQRPFNWIK